MNRKLDPFSLHIYQIYELRRTSYSTMSYLIRPSGSITEDGKNLEQKWKQRNKKK